MLEWPLSRLSGLIRRLVVVVKVKGRNFFCRESLGDGGKIDSQIRFCWGGGERGKGESGGG